MDSKQRAKLRAEANSLEAIFQIGKEGASDNLVNQLSDALDARELIKVRVHLDTAPQSARNIADEIALKLGADVIQVIGGVIVLYRKSEKKEKKKKKKITVKPKKQTRSPANSTGKRHFSSRKEK